MSEESQGYNDVPESEGALSAQTIAEGKWMAVLAYIFFPIPLLAARDNEFVRYHLRQALVLVGLFVGVLIVGVLFSVVPVLGFLISLLAGLACAGILVLAVIGLVHAAQGEVKEIPLTGPFADQVPL